MTSSKNTVASSLLKSLKSRERISTATGSTIPEDAVRPGADYEEQGFFLSVNKKTYLTIRVTHVSSPDSFCFMLLENLKHLEECWKGMAKFYDGSIGERYKVVQEDLVRALPVACKFQSSWRRGQIVDFTLGNDCTIQVMDVDSGEVRSVKLDDVRLLRKEYLQLQKQAIEAATPYVGPANGQTWTSDAFAMVNKFVKKWPLVAEVVGMIGDKFGLLLCDTSDPKVDVYLPDLLIKTNHAKAQANVEQFVFCKKKSMKKSQGTANPNKSEGTQKKAD